jgi:CheY-like chemotaxis protein
MSDNQQKHVLVVDDDDLLRDFYSRVLKTHGYEVICATNGDEAINILEEEKHVALVIADLLMPVRTGWELIEFMKGQDEFKDIPIIAITGLAASIDEFEKIEQCCDAVLHKGDFDLETFMTEIRKLLS